MTPKDTISNEETVLSLRNLYAGYGKGNIIVEVSLEVRKGESLAIIGPSGGGKSTLLRCINLLQPLTSGEIIYCGEKIASGPEYFVDVNRYRQSVAMVHQDLNLWANKTVLENLIEAPRFVLRMNLSETVENANGWLSRFGLDTFQNRFPSQLSGGQRQRVAIARALMMNSPVVIFDEVTSGLDVETTEELLRLLETLKDGKRTFIFVSHHLVFAQRATDRVVVLINGRIEETGLSSEVIRNPQNEQTRKFLSAVRATY